MAKKSKSGKSAEALQATLRRFVRTRGAEYLRDPNVTSIGVGRKNEGKEKDRGGETSQDGEISIVFTVGKKASGSALEALDTKELPKAIEFEGITIPTDVLERKYEPSYKLVEVENPNFLKTRLDPVVPGASISHMDGSAGTIGLIVFDEETGSPCVLSNWHVLHGNTGEIGDPIVQPGPHDDNNLTNNFCGELLRSHLGPAGDCALSRLRDRGFVQEIHNLGVVPDKLADVDLDDTVVKTGRTTGTTYGKVRRTDVIAKIDYGLLTGEKSIGCFEIEPDPDFPAPGNEISSGGDSGSAWMIADGKAATTVFAGLHFAGESGDNPDEHALACYPVSVQNKMRFTLKPPEKTVLAGDIEEAIGSRTGFDDQFLGFLAPMPEMSRSIKIDAVNFKGRQTIPYTHFSVCLSGKRRMPRFVAWNIDGAQKVTLGDHAFKQDDRIAAKFQLDNSIYEGNKLDRGHVARRADLAWGPVPEAKQANRDSFFYTNIAPQHERFNRSSLSGLWGRLENLVLEEAATQDIKVSVIAGPVFADDDPEYRGVLIPRAFWKLIAYLGENGNPATACFQLSQNDFLSDIEAIDFDPFRLFQISVEELSERTKLDFSFYEGMDVTLSRNLLTEARTEELKGQVIRKNIREITSADQIAI
ncbi:DNA/RNA non-specific endonuclease [Roseibium sp. M-1]